MAAARAEDWIACCAARLDAAGVAFGHGTDNAGDEAAWLVQGALGGAPPDAAARRRLDALLARRIGERVPAAHLLGEMDFHGLALHTPPGVMIPRSPIALALGAALDPYLRAPPGRVLDLCCGGGALGLLAARAYPQARVDLADVDARALDAARRNARRHPALAARVEVVRSDLFSALAGRRYDLVLCNPPYVPADELAAAPAEFRHEPRRGLDGGADGLGIWRRIVAELDGHLADDGVLVGEAGNIAQRFDAAFAQLRAIWLHLDDAEPQADGSFGVFAALRALRPGPR